MTVTARTWLVYLDEEECARLLSSSTLGRLAVVVDGHPEIFPVSHVFDPATRTVAFPTQAGTKLHAALQWPSVAFEVDHVDVDGAEGWSVLVVGRPETVADAGEVARLAAERRALWVADESARWLRIVPTKMSGRRIGAAAITPGRPSSA
jgi:uncharacterized protein